MNDAPRSAGCVRFGAFEFNPQIGELLKHGLKIKLSGQPIELLAMLLARPGQLVTREELQKRLWPHDTIVEFEHSINAAVKTLRRATRRMNLATSRRRPGAATGSSPPWR